MALLKKPAKKKVEEKEEKLPMFHKGDLITFAIDDDEIEAKILKVNTDDETAKVETDDGDEYEVEFKEMKLADKKKAKTEPDEVEEDDKPKKKGKGTSLTSVLNKTKTASSAVGLPEGTWEAIAIEAGTNETAKGTSGFIKYTIVNDKEEEGKTGVQFYQLLDPEGEVQQGASFFKRSLVTLGMMEEDDEIDDLDDLLAKLTKKKLYVQIKVVEKNGYINIYLNELLDQDDKPDPLPF